MPDGSRQCHTNAASRGLYTFTVNMKREHAQSMCWIQLSEHSKDLRLHVGLFYEYESELICYYRKVSRITKVSYLVRSHEDMKILTLDAVGRRISCLAP